jgi:cytochrome c peroxidase
MRNRNIIVAAALLWAGSLGVVWPQLNQSVAPVVYGAQPSENELDSELARVLRQHQFTGRIEAQLITRLGRPINQELATLGRLLFFDNAHSLHQDNTCAGCHSPSNGFGDTQSIAIGVDSNKLVGPNRAGPRNQRRSPMVINTAFFPALMWNGRFNANHEGAEALGDPFNNVFGFHFPAPEGDVQFPPNDPTVKHLLQAQAFIPPTELVEVAGFTGTAGTIGPEFDQFDNGLGLAVPAPDASGFRNEPIREKTLAILNSIPGYRLLFGRLFPEVAAGGPITFSMFGLAIAEFEFTLTFADAPIDRFARGRTDAMTPAQKRGALVFFDEGRGKCVTCHAVKGRSNEMFSDFQNYVIGVPQIAPVFGVGKSNMIYDGPGRDEDFGLEQITGSAADRYRFRTAPLRNIALAPAFFHNGAFTRLDDAIRYHLNAAELGPRYNAKAAGIDRDLTKRLGPVQPVINQLDAELVGGIHLTERETHDLVEFVKDGLLDERARSENLCKLVPPSVPSRVQVLEFEACNKPRK